MTRDWIEQLNTWSQSPSQSEAEKCSNAERAIRKAISASPALSDRSISVCAQGSYRNRTNVRQDSDVDIGILCTNTFHYTLPDGTAEPKFNISPASYTASEFRADVQAALVDYFGASHLTVGKHAFGIHENTYRINADVVACFEFRLYETDGTYQSGAAVLPHGGGYVMNWPEQNYTNGVAKNETTRQSYKGIVRILKNLRNEMEAEGDLSAAGTKSFLLESLAYNVPPDGFSNATYHDDLRWVLAHLCDDTRFDADCAQWTEVNDIKYLFRDSQPWTRAGANAFLNAAWRYVGYQ